MPVDSRLEPLLSRWHEQMARGELVEAATLARDCPELLVELEQQIAVLRRFEGFRVAPTEGVVIPPPETGTWPAVPGYQIIGELGRGGMGVVYKARQIALNRLVALKMILAGRQAGEEMRCRFLAEAEVVAQLRHAHIVQIHDFGTHQGHPYYTMEYIEGGNLADWLAGHPLPPADAAALVEMLARAMAHAHQAGVVHRDLKPANVLLQKVSRPDAESAESRREPAGSEAREEKGTLLASSSPSVLASSALSAARHEILFSSLVPRITDFGLAKKIDAPGQTQTGAILGTPSYMAPEQARGSKEVGPLADVYALGAILYECLTGRPPFMAATSIDTIRQVLEEDPVAVRVLQPRVARDVETICLKCLHKDPAKRYASALALAEDLRRFQDGKPIHARPIGPFGRAIKWARRQPALAGMIAVSLLALLLLTVGSIVTSIRLDAMLQAMEWQRDQALASRRVAHEAIDRFLSQMAEERMKNVPEMETTRKQMLEDALAFYQLLLAGQDNDPSMRREVARSHRRVADINQMLGIPRRAEEHYRIAVRQHEELADDPDHAADLAACHEGMGRLFFAQRRLEEALTAWQAACDLRLRQEKSPRQQAGRAVALQGLGVVQRDLGWLAAAEQSLAEALNIWKTLEKQFPAEAEYRYRLAVAHNDLAFLHTASAGQPQVAAGFEQAIALLELLAREPRQPVALEARSALARAYRNQGAFVLVPAERTAEAERAYHRALGLWKELADRHPGIVAYQNERASTLVNLGILYAGTGRMKEGREKHQEALTLLKPILASLGGLTRFDFTAVRARWGLAFIYQRQGLQQQARKEYDAVEPVLRDLARQYPDNPDHLAMLGRLHHHNALVLENVGQTAAALSAFEKAHQARSELVQRYPTSASHRSDLIWTLARLHSVYRATGQADKAENAAREAIDRLATLAREHPQEATYPQRIAWVLHEAGKPFDALTWLDRGDDRLLEMLRRPGGAGANLVTLHDAQEARLAVLGLLNAEEAIRQADRMVQRMRPRGGESEAGQILLAWSHLTQARLLQMRDRLDQAERAAREAVAILRRLPNLPDHHGIALDLLGQVLHQRGKTDEARDRFEQALAGLRAALKRHPESLFRRRLILSVYTNLAERLLKNGKYVAAAALAGRLASEELPGVPERVSAPAGWYARCAAAARADTHVAEPTRQARAEEYARRAVALLREAVEAGYHDVRQLETDPILDGLRTRADFQATLARSRALAAGQDQHPPP